MESNPEKKDENILMRPDHELPAPHDMQLEPGYDNELTTGSKRTSTLNRKIPLWIFPIIAFLIVLVAGCIYLFNQQKSTLPVTQNNIQAPITTPTIDPLGGVWVPYNNPELPVTLTYPKYISINNEIRISGSSPTQKDPLSCFANETQIVPSSDAPFDGFCLYLDDRKSTTYDNYISQQKAYLLSTFERGADEKIGTQSAILINEGEISILQNVGYRGTDYYYVPLPKSTKLLVIAKSDYSDNSFDSVMGKILQSLQFTTATQSSNLVTPSPVQQKEQVMCTMDAKQCPDGSFVSRSGPACEFAACPK